MEAVPRVISNASYNLRMSTRLLVDGNGIVCRTWWASTSNVVERFRAAVERARPSTGAEVIVCWDHADGSWRRDLYSRYKAARPPKPKGLFKALDDCHGVFDQLEAPGFEADDIIATLVRRYSFVPLTMILSDDKDMAQLVWRRCLTVSSSGQVYGIEAVRARFGVPPERIRHLLSWMGDKSDGLPGVPGYGAKKSIAKALAGEIGNQLTYDLTELATVPDELMRKY